MKESTARLAEAIGEIHDRYIHEAESYRLSRRARFCRRGAVAAAVLLLAGSLAVCAFWGDPGGPAVPPPTYDGAYLSADRIGQIFDRQPENDGATNAYTTVYAPSPGALGLAPQPTDEYALVWRYTPQTKALNRSELEGDIAAIYPRLEAMLGVTIPALTYETDAEDGTITADYKWNSIRYNIRATQLSGRNSYSISDARTVIQISGMYWDTIDINGRPIEVDQRQTDEEILASLAEVRDVLFTAFGQSFTAARVEREYGSYNEEGVEWLTVTYYNDSNRPTTGDNICITFDNFQNFSDDTVSATVLRECDIRYTRYRDPHQDSYAPESNCRLLTVEEAEVLLRAGYVFGGHVCPLCMAGQKPISFDQYDFVTLVYCTGDPTQSGSALSVPFYAFYKDIGESKNGNRTYARTLVPAVEVSGLDEYFDLQKENHRNNVVYEEAIP